jgi:hypothetical protein
MPRRLVSKVVSSYGRSILVAADVDVQRPEETIVRAIAGHREHPVIVDLDCAALFAEPALTA